MSEIRLITEDTDIDSLKMSKMDWDVEVQGVPYQVVRIEGYIHSIGGRWGENNLWMYPRFEIPTYDNLVECGSYNTAKEKGLVRSEGKEYVMQDGDVVLFRFNV